MKKRIAILLILTTTLIFTKQVNIIGSEQSPSTDTPSFWAEEGIKWLRQETNIKEEMYEDYIEPINRLDFAYLTVMLYENLTGETLSNSIITDTGIFIDSEDEYVLKAYYLGIVNGYGNGTYGPLDHMTREQVAVMLMRTIKLAGINLSTEGMYNKSFQDQSDISSWAIESVRLAYKHKIVNGVGDDYIEPLTKATKEQGLLLIYNIISEKDAFITEKPTTKTIAQVNLRWSRGGSYKSWSETAWYSTPQVADLDGDGKNEIISSAYSIVVLDEETGELKWRVASGHDRSESNVSGMGRTWSDLVVKDIDGDGDLEILSAHGEGVVSVYDHNGYFVDGWPQQPIDRELRGLKVADLDLDGTDEIIVTGAVSSKENIWVYEHDGTLRQGWPQLSDDSGYAYGVFNNNVSVGDLSGDNRLEIVLPSDVHYICAYDSYGNHLDTAELYGDKKWGAVGVWESLNTEIRGWGKLDGNRAEDNRPNFAHGASLVADVNNDGINEIIAIGNVHDATQSNSSGLYNGLYIFNSDRTRFKDGIFNWEEVPVDTGGPLAENYKQIESNQPDPVVADLNKDGYKEIIYSSYDGKIHCLHLDKSEHDNWPYDVMAGTNLMEFASVPEVIDITGNGYPEVIVTTWTEKDKTTNGDLIILDYQGNELLRTELPNDFNKDQGNGGLASPQVIDSDGDGDYEIIINSINSGVLLYDVIYTLSN